MKQFAKCAECGKETDVLLKDVRGDSGFDAGQYTDAQVFCSKECFEFYEGAYEDEDEDENNELQNL